MKYIPLLLSSIVKFLENALHSWSWDHFFRNIFYKYTDTSMVFVISEGHFKKKKLKKMYHYAWKLKNAFRAVMEECTLRFRDWHPKGHPAIWSCSMKSHPFINQNQPTQLKVDYDHKIKDWSTRYLQNFKQYSIQR